MHSQRRIGLLSFVMLATLLVSCSILDSANAYRHEAPSEFYLYLPGDNRADQAWTIFVGLHGEGETGRDCFKNWQPFADEFEFVLVCPTLLEEDGKLVTLESERRIAGVLTEIYRQITAKERFFLTGFSAGAEFALAYAYRYPHAIVGVSAISAQSFPQPTAKAVDLPVLITVGELETDRVEITRKFAESLNANGFTARLLVLQGVDHKLSGDATRITLDFLRQVSRKELGEY
jgi:poly(3-hydroxybutyrate) depolymerase